MILLIVTCFGSMIQRTDPVYERTFNSAGSLEDLVEFSFTDRNAWRVNEGSLELLGGSDYAPPVRSPLNIALINNVNVGSFTMDVKVRQTGKEYGHRDMCIFFGFQDPSHFYYVHLASVADENAHNVFIVNGAPRTNIASITTSGVQWGEEWHVIRVQRDVTEGSITIYFDDMNTPVMRADDKHFTSGYLGVGSFDDSGLIESITVLGEKISDNKISVFE